MLHISIQGVVQHIVQHELLDTKSQDDRALYLNFDLRLSYFAAPGGFDQSRGLHLLYQALPGSSWVNVFSGVTDSPFGNLREITEWKHECSHDSCWREIRVFTDVYFDMAECINVALQSKGKAAIPPKDMHEWHSFRTYQRVPVKVSKDATDINSYRKRIEPL